jgi:2-polyprenyl-3-methyl-5-hydroxy-6-metoxy-1,4-benzoquinol methylase
MSRELDALTASTLKYLRERWWDDGFAKFLAEVLEPKPGCRLLDVGCGPGTAGFSLAAHGLRDVTIVGVDLAGDKLASAVAAPRPDRVRLAFAAAAVAGREFVEIQSTPLFATSGRRLAE